MKIVKSKNSTREVINPREIHRSYIDKIEEDLTSVGAIIFDESKVNIDPEYLVLPPELTEIPSQLLGSYLNAFTQQKMYVRTLLGRTELLIEEARREYAELYDPIYCKLTKDSKSKYSETAKEKLIMSDDTIREKYYTYIDLKKKCSILELSIANIEDAIFLLSREVTRRNSDFEEDTRNYNVGRK